MRTISRTKGFDNSRRRATRPCDSLSAVCRNNFSHCLCEPSVAKQRWSTFARYERLGRVSGSAGKPQRSLLSALTAFDRRSRRTTGEPMKFVVSTYKKGNHRKSALQAAILDPRKDHTNSRQKGFPCLQQVGFTPLRGDGMSVTGFTQPSTIRKKPTGIT